jgi:YgiT-type zinc finger domain-containing protein
MRELPSMTNKNPEDSHHSSLLCQECQTGARRLKYLTYFTWLNSELVTVPNFPAWVCDICGRREYDSRAIVWLNAMLHPDTGHRSVPRPRTDQQARSQQL